MALLQVALLVASAAVASYAANVTGTIVYVAFDSDTTLKGINLASKNKVSQLLKFPPYQYPTWSESSTTNQYDMFFYNFINNDDVTGITVGVNVTEKKIKFSYKTNYFWRLGFDPTNPEFLYGLTMPNNNILLQRINITDGKAKTVGQFPAGDTQPDNSAVFDDTAGVFYAYVGNAAGGTSVFGIDVSSGLIVSNGTVDSSYYICEAVKDESTGTFYGIVMDSDSNAWLAKLNPKTGAATKVGTAKFAISSCDAGSSLSSSQRLYFAYIKDNEGNSEITVWNLDTGALVEHFDVENAVFGMQLFE